MATNFFQEGEFLEFTAPAGGVTAGVPVLIGGFFVIPEVTAAAGARFNGGVEDAWILNKPSGEVWVEGQPVYWDSVNLVVSTDPTVGLPIGASIFAQASGTTTAPVNLNEIAHCGRQFVLRKRVPVASLNAGNVTLLNAIPNLKYRLVDAMAIAVGGAAAGVTTVDLKATQSASLVKLVAFAQASLTQSAVLRAGGAGAAVLADGASFVQNDIGTAVVAGTTGAAITGATNIDFQLIYTLE